MIVLSMCEPTPTGPNFDFGKLCMLIGGKNDQIWARQVILNLIVSNLT